ncbi:hypothetical protein BD324DRAFT_617207 [Kockovaella imperatae]|uniref:KN homeodomain domain-containing protein n=1 Tax=Kockovaella imperatae TaxID=4999 RepID=A0A1Y1USW2_9TREE|nr:hypothetical protein BD324DRAFT_617207 [Kockovaella imperatae]ORX40295.1 hypothetical protein BD324DRAFT_617207 [Kockovaella imperatae]
MTKGLADHDAVIEIDFGASLDRLHQNTMTRLTDDPHDVSKLAQEWELLRARISLIEGEGRLAPNIVQKAYLYAANVAAAVKAVIGLESRTEETCRNLVRNISGVMDRAKTSDPERDNVIPPSDLSLSSPQILVGAPLPGTTNDHLRFWFLDNLASPYPTPNEKDNLANLLGVDRKKVDSDLTNWRRRAGWTDIKDTYCDKSRVLMKELMERVESGEETDQDILDAVENMKAYLERREEEKVGDWVHELASLAQPRKRVKQADGTSRAVSSNCSTLDLDLDEVDHHSLSQRPSISSLRAVADTVGRRTRSKATRKGRATDSSISSSSSWSLSSEAARGFTFAPSERTTSGVSDISIELQQTHGTSTDKNGPNKRALPSDMNTEQTAHPAIRMKTDMPITPYNQPGWCTPPSSSPRLFMNASPTEYNQTPMYTQAGGYFVQQNQQTPIYPQPDGFLPPPTYQSTNEGSSTSIWSTSNALPMLPHMMTNTVNGFMMPTTFAFQPQFGWQPAT